jgi:hypothetical protein
VVQATELHKVQNPEFKPQYLQTRKIKKKNRKEIASMMNMCGFIFVIISQTMQHNSLFTYH